MKKFFFGVLVVLAACASGVQAIPVLNHAVPLTDFFQVGQQGLYDVWYQAYFPHNNSWYNLGVNGNMWKARGQDYLPVPDLLPWLGEQGNITATPSCLNDGYFKPAFPVIKIKLWESEFPAVRIQGFVYAENAAPLTFSIFKGAANAENPIWTATPAGPIDLVIPYTAGDEIFLMTSSVSVPAEGNWCDIRFTGVPEPLTLALLAAGAMFIRRS